MDFVEVLLHIFLGPVRYIFGYPRCVRTVDLDFKGGINIFATLKCVLSARRICLKTQLEFKVQQMTFGVQSNTKQTPRPTSRGNPREFIYSMALRIKPSPVFRTEHAIPIAAPPSVITHHSTTRSLSVGMKQIFACGIQISEGSSTSSEAYEFSPASTNHDSPEVAWTWSLNNWADGSVFSPAGFFYRTPRLPCNLTPRDIQFFSTTDINDHALDMHATWEVDNDNICWDVEMDLSLLN